MTLAKRMSDAWVRFAATGDPNGDDLPQWDAYTPDNRAMMLFDTTVELAKDPAGMARRAMAPLLNA